MKKKNKINALGSLHLTGGYNLMTSCVGTNELVLIDLNHSSLIKFYGFNALVVDLLIKGTNVELVKLAVVKEFGLPDRQVDIELENFLEYLLKEKIMIIAE